MEYLLIQYYNEVIKEHNKANRDRLIKKGMSAYSKPWKIGLWTIWGLCIFFAIALFVFAVLLEKDVQNVTFRICFLRCLIFEMIFIIVFLIVNSIAEKVYVGKRKATAILRLEKLKEVVISIYGEERLDEKVSLLSNMYEEKVKQIESESAKRAKLLGTVIPAIGTVIFTSFVNMDKLGIEINEWLSVILLFLFLAAIVLAPIYLFTIIEPSKDSYRVMENSLKHLRIRLLVETDMKKANDETKAQTSENEGSQDSL